MNITDHPPADENSEALKRLQEADEIVDDLIDTCPVKPLGLSGGVYFFITPMGQLREVKFNELNWNGIHSLFEGDLNWLVASFPVTSSRNGASDERFAVKDAANFLVRACRAQGLYDDSLRIRRVGTWADEPEGTDRPRLVVHCGDKLLIDNKYHPAGQKIGSALYIARPRIQAPARDPASRDDGQFLVETLRFWPFMRGEIDVQLMVGWIGQAMLGAAPSWRAHMMVTAPHGSGKSWLTNAVKNAIGDGAHDISNNFTEAGLRQSLTQEARTMILDEAEHEEGGGRVVKVIELLRQMAGGEGARGVRGSAGGAANGFTVTGCAYLASVLHVPLAPQDRSRIMHLSVRALTADIPPERIEELGQRIKALQSLSPLYRKRMIENWPMFQRCISTYKASLMRAGLKPRPADHLSALLAGRDALLKDHHPTEEQIAHDVSMAAGIIADLQEEEKTNNEGMRCLNHLYTSMVDLYRGGEKETIGQLAVQAIEDNTKDKNKLLGQYGLRFEPFSPHNSAPARLIVANQSNGLEKIFANTRWASGVWAQTFIHLPGHEKVGTQRYGGAPSKGIAIPQAFWPKNEEDD